MKGAWNLRPASPLGAAYGLELPASWTSQPRSVSHWDLSLAAARQVAAAGSRSRLRRAQDAEDVAIMWSAPQDLEHALYLAAFWVAVAARVEGRWSLAAQATRYLAEGKLRANMPGRNQDPDRMRDVLDSARAEVADPAIRAVLQQATDAERQKLTRDRAADTSLQQQYVQPLVATIDTFRDPRQWPWYAWAVGGVIVLLFLGGWIVSSGPRRRQAAVTLRRGAGYARESVSATRRKLRQFRQQLRG